jgi:hypothetical protein
LKKIVINNNIQQQPASSEFSLLFSETSAAAAKLQKDGYLNGTFFYTFCSTMLLLKLRKSNKKRMT